MTKDQAIYQHAKHCGTKRRYGSAETASRGGCWDVYECDLCHGFHRSTPVGVKALEAVRRVRPPAEKKKHTGTLPRSITMLPRRGKEPKL